MRGYQGNYWGNHNGGESIAAVVHARLQNSPRVTKDLRAADVFFIPLQVRNMCFAGDQWHTVDYFKQCGVDFARHQDLPGMWRWMLEQPSFKFSDGADHFIIVDPPMGHVEAGVRTESPVVASCA